MNERSYFMACLLILVTACSAAAIQRKNKEVIIKNESHLVVGVDIRMPGLQNGLGTTLSAGHIRSKPGTTERIDTGLKPQSPIGIQANFVTPRQEEDQDLYLFGDKGSVTYVIRTDSKDATKFKVVRE